MINKSKRLVHISGVMSFIIVYKASFENNFVGPKPRKSNQYVSTMLNKV
jgi:hypothetical protein